jgi:hypothetical protein
VLRTVPHDSRHPIPAPVTDSLRLSVTRSIARRLILMIPTLIGVSLLITALLRLLPGDAVDILVTENAVGGGSQVFKEIVDQRLIAAGVDPVQAGFGDRIPVENELVGNQPTSTASISSIEAQDPCADLDAWDDAIAALNTALVDTATARAVIEAGLLTMDRIEAGYVLTIDGGNAETRKARLTLALADDACHEAARGQVATARQALADADRRVLVTRERCRLLRAALALVGDA